MRSPAAGSCSIRTRTRTPGATPATDAGLHDILVEARALGFLGPHPVEDHIAHAGAFLAPLQRLGDDVPLVVDLGSGGGVPALVLALALPVTRWWLVESAQRRSAFLVDAVGRLGLADRVELLARRAEDVGRDSARRGLADAVTARSFGPPAVTAECGAPLLRVGGLLVVSEPPGGVDDRWSTDGLRQVGLAPPAIEAGPPAMAVLTQEAWCPPRWPRRPGIPTKRPLW